MPHLELGVTFPARSREGAPFAVLCTVAWQPVRNPLVSGFFGRSVAG